MSHIFISYARKEGYISEKLEGELKKSGFQTWRDTQNTTPSRSFHDEAKQSIKKASHFIVCLTEWVDKRPENIEQLEIAYALAEDQKRQHQDLVRRLPIIPLVFPGGILPPIIQSWETIHVNQNLEEGDLEDLIDRIRHAIGDPGQIIPSRLEKHLKSLQSDNYWNRSKAANKLGQIRDPTAIPALTHSFHDVFLDAPDQDHVAMVQYAASLATDKFEAVDLPFQGCWTPFLMANSQLV